MKKINWFKLVPYAFELIKALKPKTKKHQDIIQIISDSVYNEKEHNAKELMLLEIKNFVDYYYSTIQDLNKKRNENIK